MSRGDLSLKTSVKVFLETLSMAALCKFERCLKSYPTAIIQDSRTITTTCIMKKVASKEKNNR